LGVISEKLKELSAARAKFAALEETVALERSETLKGLPAQYGFDDLESFVAALRAASGKRRGRKSGSKNATSPKPGKKARRKRATITDETRSEVKRLVGAGKTGNDIAEILGISLPSVQNIKKALGLVTKRK
jgi:DNA-binding NarL/FixJ family response regulator